MNDSIELKLVTEDEAECLHRLQVEAFMPLYEKYQDDDTSPAKESLKRVTEKILLYNLLILRITGILKIMPVIDNPYGSR